jgi:hypothetical protein
MQHCTHVARHCALLRARRDEILKLFSSLRDKSHCAIVNDFCGGRSHRVFPEVFFWPNGLNYGLKCPKRYPEYLLRGFCAKEARPKWRPAPSVVHAFDGCASSAAGASPSRQYPDEDCVRRPDSDESNIGINRVHDLVNMTGKEDVSPKPTTSERAGAGRSKRRVLNF